MTHDELALPVLAVIGDAATEMLIWPEGDGSEGSGSGAHERSARITTTLGGSAAHVAVAAAENAKGAFRTRFIGQIGGDHLGDHLVRVLGASGVDPCVHRAGSSAKVVTVFDAHGGTHRFVDRAAAHDLTAIPAQWLEGVRMLHVPFSALVAEPMRSTALYAISAVQAMGAQVSLDLSAMSVLEEISVREVRQLLEQIGPHIVFAGTEEALAMDVDVDPHPSVGIHVVTAGAEPAQVGVWVPDLVRHDFIVEWTSVSPRAALPPLAISGARDRFAGGFLAARLRGADPVAAAAEAHDVAAGSVAGSEADHVH